ncbi:Uncharacterized protein Fot_56613 [Forsythia ovata]|uniref:Uncharacterized protein n=1 Tax=Forsythia ovata TaxID=205694 RepID=A0ABD1NZ50_9LAMI
MEKELRSACHAPGTKVDSVFKDPRFERLPCTHKGTYADDCLVERVTQEQAKRSSHVPSRPTSITMHGLHVPPPSTYEDPHVPDNLDCTIAMNPNMVTNLQINVDILFSLLTLSLHFSAIPCYGTGFVPPSSYYSAT